MFWHIHLQNPIFFLLLSLATFGSMPHTLENKGYISTTSLPPPQNRKSGTVHIIENVWIGCDLIVTTL